MAELSSEASSATIAVEIFIKPKIFATYIPLPPTERITADTSRVVQKTEKVTVDTSRIIGAPPTRASTFRKVVAHEKNYADIYRVVAINESIAADTALEIIASEKITADLLRGLREIIRADTHRQINRTERAVACTVIRVPHVLNYVLRNRKKSLKASPKAKLLTANSVSLVDTFKEYGVTAVNITLNERTLSDDFRFDIAARAVEINETVQGWLLDYPFHFLVEETTQTDMVQSVKGRYSVDDLLYTQFFIATIKIKSNDGKTIEIPGGRYEKYRDGAVAYFYPRAEEIMTKVAEYFLLIPDVRIDDFTPYNLSGDHRITYADLLNSIFGWTSRLPQRQINVFIRGGTLHCIQRGKEDSIFDITDLSHSRPIVNKKLIRSLWSNPKDEDTDSHDKPKPDDSNSPLIDYIYDEVQEPFSGTLEFQDEGCSTVLRYQNGLLMRESNDTSNAKATLSSSVSYAYEEIFPADMSEISIRNQKAFNKNFYGDFYTIERNLRSEATTVDNDGNYKKTEQFGSIRYRYARTEGDDLYLSSEIDETTSISYEMNDDGVWKESDRDTDVRETFHVPIGNGWYGQSVYHNGAAQGSNISQGTPGNKVSQYMMGEVQKTFKGFTITYDNPSNPSNPDKPDNPNNPNNDDAEDYDDWRRKLAPIADISFPVRELDLLEILTKDLLWLNRKVQETVNVNLIAKVNDGVPNIQHIVDFTERIKLDDAEYFLVSNRITFTPRGFIQKLQLIRWY